MHARAALRQATRRPAAWRSLIGVVSTGILLQFTSTLAQAVPSYARQTGSECASCHVGGFGPQLTPYGIKFKINGYTDSNGDDAKVPLSGMLVANFSRTARNVAEGDKVEHFEKGGFTVDHLKNAEPALSALELTHYDLAIVDIGLPGMNGLELVRQLRQKNIQVAVIILTAHDALGDRISGLDLGADDYMVKPFHLSELLARIRALIRRSRSSTASRLTAGTVRLDLARHVATANGASLDLTGREWEIMQQLMLAMPNVVNKHKMAESISAWENEITANAVETYISRLRHKVQGCGIEIRTIRGIGYRLDEL